MFVDLLASNDDDGGHICVKMPRAAVEEQLFDRPESCSVSDSESEASVTHSRRVTGGKRVETHGDMDLWAMDVEPLQ